jgi:hypothetical protein
MVLRDFNLHYTLWGEKGIRNDIEAEELIEIMKNFGLISIMPLEIITYEKGHKRSIIDLCLEFLGITAQVIRSRIDNKINHDSDYLPIAISINLRMPQITRAPIRRWKKMDGEIFQKALREKLPKLKRLNTFTALDYYTEKVVHAIWKAAEAATSTNNPTA